MSDLQPKDSNTLDLTTMKDLVISALEDVKGFDITVLDVRKLTSMTCYMVICSATSSRQAQSLADHVKVKVKEHGFDVRGLEGDKGSEWVLVDLDDIVVHIMVPTTRAYFNLEQLWGEKESGTRHITPDNLN